MGSILKEPVPAHHDPLKTTRAGSGSNASPASNSIPQAWRIWARELQRLRLESWVATLLESAGILTVLGAQAIYLSQPLLKRTRAGDQLSALAGLLEEPELTRSFVDYLREGDPN